jgi:hypothetical protein
MTTLFWPDQAMVVSVPPRVTMCQIVASVTTSPYRVAGKVVDDCGRTYVKALFGQHDAQSQEAHTTHG